MLRLSVFGLVALTVFYWIMRIYLRSVHREQLENDWDADHPDDQPRDEAAREAHKAAWYWGGSGGMAVGGVLICLATLPQAGVISSIRASE